LLQTMPLAQTVEAMVHLLCFDNTLSNNDPVHRKINMSNDLS